MRGPVAYLERVFARRDTQADVLATGSERDLVGTRSVAILMDAAFAIGAVLGAREAADHADAAYHTSDGVVMAGETIGAVLDVGGSVLAGWGAVEMTAFAAAATIRIREGENGNR